MIFVASKSLFLSRSWHQTTRQTIMFSPIFSTNFPQFDQLKKKTNFFLVQTGFFSVLDQWKVFSFSTAKTEKNSWKKFGGNMIGGLMSRIRYFLNIVAQHFMEYNILSLIKVIYYGVLTTKPLKFVFTCSLLSDTKLKRKQNGLKLQFLSWIGQLEKMFLHFCKVFYHGQFW